MHSSMGRFEVKLESADNVNDDIVIRAMGHDKIEHLFVGKNKNEYGTKEFILPSLD